MDFEKLNQILYGEPKVDYENELNKEQLEAVRTLEGPVLIIAGAGSGKTRTLTYRLSNMVEKGVTPERILLLTFTNKAADEMVSRAKGMLDERCGRVTACTYHSFCANILRRHAEMIGIDNSFVIHDTGDSIDTINLVRSNLGHARDNDFPKGKELAGMFGMHVNKGLSFEDIIQLDYKKYKGYADEVESMFHEYNGYKLEHCILDYDDLLIQMNRLLTEHPDVRKSLSDRYQYIMVDEYQDSNALQLEMLTLMRSCGNNNLCVVGDDFQSIYGFRGSEVKNILNFPKQFEGCKIITLNKNYRSNQEILDLANAVTENAEEKYDKQLEGLCHKNAKPVTVIANDGMASSKFVLAKILEYKDAGVPLSEIAVLIRRAADSFELEGMLAKASSYYGITYQKFGGLKFLEKTHIKDILAYIKILINPMDEVSWFRLFQLYPNIGPVYARRLSEGIIKNGLEELIDKRHTSKKYGKHMPELYKAVSELRNMEFQNQINTIINKYYVEARECTINSQTEAAARESRDELKQDINEAQILIELADGYKSATSFITDLTLDAKNKDADKESLTISTIHSAKGLEFQVVFVLNCLEGTFPCIKARPDTNEGNRRAKEELAEERRVFYVAITRAKEDLYLMCPKVISKFGHYEEGTISRFIAEDNIYRNLTEIEQIKNYDYY